MKTPVISRLQQINGKWWFITPDGYKFLLKGVDAASIWEWGYGTPFKKADGTPKRVFEELPDPGAYAPAYANDANGERVSFLVANVMKIWQRLRDEVGEHHEKPIDRLGVHAFSKWSKPSFISDFPYIEGVAGPD